MKQLITEEQVEENVLDILKSLDYDIIRGSNEECLPGGSPALRSDHEDVVLVDKADRLLTLGLNMHYHGKHLFMSDRLQ